MGRYRSRSRSGSITNRSPARRKRYDEPRDRRRDRRSPEPTGLLVRNISLSARPEDVRGPFERFGPIKDVYLPKNYNTGEPRGFGFVKFRYAEDAAQAKAHLNCTVIGGREIRIVFAEENRKTPQEMRRVSRISGPGSRGSFRRHSPPRFSSRRYRCQFEFQLTYYLMIHLTSDASTPPTNQYAKKNKEDELDLVRARSIFFPNSLEFSMTAYSRSTSPARRDSRDRDHESRDDHYSPRRSRSKSRSVSPRDERKNRSNGRSSRKSRPMSRSNSPRVQNKRGRFSLSPRDKSQVAHDVDSAPRRIKSPGRNADSSIRSRSKSYSPR